MLDCTQHIPRLMRKYQISTMFQLTTTEVNLSVIGFKDTPLDLFFAWYMPFCLSEEDESTEKGNEERNG